MLTRIISGLVMALFAILAILFFPAGIFNLLALLIFMGGLWEWNRLCNASFGSFALAIMAMLFIYAAYTVGYLSITLSLLLLTAGILYWAYKTVTLPRILEPAHPLCVTEGVLALSLAWLAIVLLRDLFGVHSLMLALLMVWSADSFAYFGGKYLGRTKLAPNISPGKTREGVISGVLMAMLVAVCYAHFLVSPLSSLTQMIVLLMVTVLVALVSVVGDLSESKLKRAAGKKDSGNLIPGHGGILDRIDGLMAGTVVYAFYAVLTQTLTRTA